VKTIKQIAEEIGVSKQAIHKRLKCEPLASRVNLSTVNRQRASLIDVDAEKLIKEAFEWGDVNRDNRQPSIKTDNLVDVLQRELDAKNRQISDLTEALAAAQRTIESDRQTIESAQRTAEAAQALHAATVKQYLEMDTVKQRDRGFFGRIFGKKENSREA